jgi:phosphoglycerate kinase
MNYLTINDVNIKGKRVFVRVDINSPIHPETKDIMDLARINEACETIKSLSECKVIVASHQGRVGGYDYVPLNKHAEALSKLLGKEVRFVEDVCGSFARESISRLNDGDVLLLDNLRFWAEENNEYSLDDAKKTIFVQRLASYLDICILDAFATAHRAHPSIIGFCQIMPTLAGLNVEKEISGLDKVVSRERKPFVLVLGGAKVPDRLKAIETLIKSEKADKVLLTGLLAQVFLKAKGTISLNLGIKDEQKHVLKARELLMKYPEKFELPKDVATEENGSRLEVEVSKLKDEKSIFDLGEETIERYSIVIKEAGTILMSGPAGLFEDKRFQKGTRELLNALAESSASKIVSGGHLTAALDEMNVRDKVDHVSTAGGALITFLSGKKLPLIEALEVSVKMFKDTK